MLRQALGVLLGGASAARPLGGRSGVRPGTSGLGSATSTTWTVNPHAGALDLEASSAAGPYLYSVDDTSNTGTVTAADATNPRIDLVYVTLNDPAEGDGSSTPGAVFGYVAGVAAGSPSAPATPARSMALFTISVPKSGTGSPTTTDVAPFTSAAGALTIVRTQAERDAMTAHDGKGVYRLDTERPEFYNGADSAWYPRTGSNIAGAGWADVTTAPFGGTTYRRDADGRCSLTGQLYRTDPTFTATSGTFYTIGFLPSWMWPTDCAKQFVSWTTPAGTGAVVRISTGGVVSFSPYGANQTVTTGIFVVSVDSWWWR
jgi:hypothetical protein